MTLFRTCFSHVRHALRVLGLVAGLWTPRAIHAQSNTPSTTAGGPAVPAALAGITTDTGAFAPGHQEFSRYSTPLSCVAAVTWTSSAARVRATVESILDTLQDIAADTIGLASVRTVARACGARFTPENTAAKYLPALLQLAQSMQNDSLALAVFTRMTQAMSPTARMQQAFDVLDILLGGRGPLGVGFVPASDATSPKLQALYTLDRPLVQALVGVIEQHGTLVDRVQVQERLREYWLLRRDMPAVLRQSDQVLAAARQLPPRTLVEANFPQNTSQPVWKIYHDLLRYAFYHWPDSLPAITQRAQRDLGAWQTYIVTLTSVTPGPIIDFRTLSPEATIDTLWPEHARWSDTARTVLPPLHADVWFGPAHVPLANTVQPVRGQVTFLFVSDAAATGAGPQQAPLVRHMMAQYGARGLAVTVMTRTRGWIDYGDYLSALEPVTPTAEAEQIRAYYQDYEHLPVTVGVQMHHYAPRPAPDGRLAQTDTLHPFPPYCDNKEYAWDNGTMCALLVGRDGTVLWHGNMLATDAEPDGALFGLKSDFPDALAKAIAEAPSDTRATRAASSASSASAPASMPAPSSPSTSDSPIPHE